jgi:hypothetical protein
MLTLQDSGARLCDGLTRREVLRVGGLTALDLSCYNFGSMPNARSCASNRSFC